jgi:hypothetical protein
MAHEEGRKEAYKAAVEEKHQYQEKAELAGYEAAYDKKRAELAGGIDTGGVKSFFSNLGNKWEELKCDVMGANKPEEKAVCDAYTDYNTEHGLGSGKPKATNTQVARK